MKSPLSKSLMILAVVCAALAAWTAGLVPSAFAADKPNVSGTWAMDVKTDQGTGTPTFDLKQEGEKLSGTYKGQLGEYPVTGSLKGNEIALNFKITGGGQGEVQVAYAGTVEGDTMKGTVNLGALGKGTFTGKKK